MTRLLSLCIPSSTDLGEEGTSRVFNVTQRTRSHTLRHGFAKANVLNRGDAFSLQRMLDHADVWTSQKHVDLDLREVHRQHDAFGPLDRLAERDHRSKRTFGIDMTYVQNRHKSC